MKYDAKSVIIGRKKRLSKDDDTYPCFVSLYGINDPHKSGEVPNEILDYPHVHKVIIEGFKKVNYLLPGNDIVINDIEELDIDIKGEHVHLIGKQTE